MATNNSINANSTTPLTIDHGGTQVTALPTSAVASAFAAWDANSNLSANNFNSGYATTATAAGTTTLTVSSARQQYFTGTTTQTVQMPVTSTLVLGQSWVITNKSTGIVTINSSGSNAIIAMAANTQVIITCILTSGTTASSWSVNYSALTAAFTTVVAQAFPSAGIFTYAPTAGMKYCLVRAQAAGGGGGGADANPGATFSAGCGGGSGSFSEGLFTAAQIGASQTVTIGAGGTAGSAGTGGTGGVTSLGALITTNGGTGGGQGPGRSAFGYTPTPGVGGASGTGGYNNFRGAPGSPGAASAATACSGAGASSFYGGGGSPLINTTGAGSSSAANGAGGSGASSLVNTAQIGGVGGAGYMEIIEFI